MALAGFFGRGFSDTAKPVADGVGQELKDVLLEKKLHISQDTDKAGRNFKLPNDLLLKFPSGIKTQFRVQVTPDKYAPEVEFCVTASSDVLFLGPVYYGNSKAEIKLMGVEPTRLPEELSDCFVVHHMKGNQPLILLYDGLKEPNASKTHFTVRTQQDFRLVSNGSHPLVPGFDNRQLQHLSFSTNKYSEKHHVLGSQQQRYAARKREGWMIDPAEDIIRGDSGEKSTVLSQKEVRDFRVVGQNAAEFLKIQGTPGVTDGDGIPDGIPSTAIPYSLNVGYLTIWPTGVAQPVVSTLNSNGAIVANAAIVPAGNSGAVSVFITDPTHVILDIPDIFDIEDQRTLTVGFPAQIGGTENSKLSGSLTSTTNVSNSAALAIGSGASAEIGGITVSGSNFNGDDTEVAQTYTSDRYQSADVYSVADAAGNHFAARGEIDSNNGLGVQVTPMDEISLMAPCLNITCITAMYDLTTNAWGGWYFLNGILGASDLTPNSSWVTVPNAGALSSTVFANDSFNRARRVYGPLDNRISITNPLVKFARYSYDLAGNLSSSITDQETPAAFTYDANGNLGSISDSFGRTTTYQYDALYRSSSQLDPINDEITHNGGVATATTDHFSIHDKPIFNTNFTKSSVLAAGFTVAFNDLRVPVAGVSIQIVRTYDSHLGGATEFGYGWGLAGPRELEIKTSNKLSNLSVSISGLYTHFVRGTTTAAFGTGITVASMTINAPNFATAVTIPNSNIRSVELNHTSDLESSGLQVKVINSGGAQLAVTSRANALKDDDVSLTVAVLNDGGSHLSITSTEQPLQSLWPNRLRTEYRDILWWFRRWSADALRPI